MTARTHVSKIDFPKFSGVRCLMMPFIQGDPESVPKEYSAYSEILSTTFIKKGDLGFLTIDESVAKNGTPHRGARSKTDRAIHTEAGRLPGKIYAWGGGGWGNSHIVTLDRDVQILLANNIDNSCALWDCEHEETSLDGDLGHVSHEYPYERAQLMKAGDVHQIGILTPHESLPLFEDADRQFLRILSSGVYGREPYFTQNPKLNIH
jgi:hypothetical protein